MKLILLILTFVLNLSFAFADCTQTTNSSGDRVQRTYDCTSSVTDSSTPQKDLVIEETTDLPANNQIVKREHYYRSSYVSSGDVANQEWIKVGQDYERPTYEDLIRSQGAVGYYPLDDYIGDGATIFEDVIGGNDFTITSTPINHFPFTEGQVESYNTPSGGTITDFAGHRSMLLDGSSEYASAASSSVYNYGDTQSWSVSGLVATSGGSSEKPMYSKVQTTSQFPGQECGVGSGQIPYMYNIADFGAGDYILLQATGFGLTAGQIYHLACVYDGSTKTGEIYLNGRLVASASTPTLDAGGADTTNSTVAKIGARTGTGRFWNGALDNVAIFNKKLTAAEIHAQWIASGYPDNRPNKPRTNLILDTDLCEDIDDAFDLTMSIQLHRKGYINLIGVNVPVMVTNAGGYAAKVLDYYGLWPEVPVGQFKGTGTQNVNRYSCDEIADVSGATTKTDFPDDVDFYRRLLSRAEDNSVTILAVGPGESLQLLMNSTADDIDPRTGLVLIEKKVKKLVWVAGRWPSGSEFNFTFNTSSRTAGNDVDANWPGRIDYIGVELADDHDSGQNILTTLNANNPVRVAAENWQVVSGGGTFAGRPAWGQMGVIYAAFDSKGWYYPMGLNGLSAVNSGTGANTFTAGTQGNRTYYGKLQADTTYTDFINSFLVEPEVLEHKMYYGKTRVARYWQTRTVVTTSEPSQKSNVFNTEYSNGTATTTLAGGSLPSRGGGTRR